MQLLAPVTIAIGAALMMASSAFAAPQPVAVAATSVPALKDATIYRSGTGCSQCPNSDCNQCTLGTSTTLSASLGARSLVQSIIGFQLPYDGSLVKTCTIQIPAFSKPNTVPVTITINNAEHKDWSDATINGANAPAVWSQVTSVTIPAYANAGPIDISTACRNAQRGSFSVYFSSPGTEYSFWSKESGNPAILTFTPYV
ncbi:hypothetical protein LPJ61_005491 [Coemansia biformis]|uniref:Carbohydrate-binding module family 96 domain-containing protein n=1 Tax=Coemansia biformis TaxID=1286918 RepID=A0A9W7Y8S1_9FUNG|nr:hypothetical protein LPJ61_005491 [Coemansia biformis]